MFSALPTLPPGLQGSTVLVVDEEALRQTLREMEAIMKNASVAIIVLTCGLLSHILQEAGLPAHALDIELSEGSVMTRDAANVAILNQLADMGVALVLDDFGSGSSSPPWRHRCPVHALKIDRPLINGIGQNADDAKIVMAIIAMATTLQVRVIAEGVETAEQVAFLKVHGCDAAQGYYYRATVAAEALDDLLND